MVPSNAYLNTLQRLGSSRPYIILILALCTVEACGSLHRLRASESAQAYHYFQCFREFSPKSERNFTCNSSPLIGQICWGDASESVQPFDKVLVPVEEGKFDLRQDNRHIFELG
jgi:hypothetical protein